MNERWCDQPKAVYTSEVMERELDKLFPVDEYLRQKGTRMTNDELELKLARLATGLVRNFDEVDRVTPEPSANHQQKVQLAREAFSEAYIYVDQLRPPRPSPRPTRRAPDSLTDHGG